MHVTGTVKLTDDCLIRGALIAGSSSTTDAVDVLDNPRIIYDPSLYTSPPQFYTTSVQMVPQSSTWNRKVD